MFPRVMEVLDELSEPMDLVLLNSVAEACIQVNTCATVLRGFAMERQFDMVLQLYDEVLAQGICRNIVRCNTVLNACCQRGAEYRVREIGAVCGQRGW